MTDNNRPKNKPKSTKKSPKNTAKTPLDKFKQFMDNIVGNNKRAYFSAKKHKSAEQMAGKQDVWRFLLVWATMGLFFVALFARAYYLQVVNPQLFLEHAKRFSTSYSITPVKRGRITDRFGVPLAANAPLVTVVFSPYDFAKEYYILQDAYDKAVKNKNQKRQQKIQKSLNQLDLTKIAQTANFPLDILQNAVNINPNLKPDVKKQKEFDAILPKSKYMVLLKDVTPEIADKVISLDIHGLFADETARRYYMQAEPMSQILGYMAQSDKDSSYLGRAGIELKYQKQLAGKEGRALVLRSGNRHQLQVLQQTTLQVPSTDVQLTIDSRLQYVLYTQMEQAGRKEEARWASGIVVDIKTGDVLAMGSWPSFNANNLSTRTGSTERNRVLLDVFEPGSVVKPLTVAAALHSGRYNTNTLIDTSPGSYRLPGYNIRDGGNYGVITLAKLIQKSSNVASAKIAFNLPLTAISDMQHKFGLGQKTAINFPGEASGRVKPPTAKEVARRATLAYGYGQQVTLAQLAQAYATLGNAGVMRPLRLVKNEPVLPPVQVISKKHADAIIKMMQLVTQEGGTAEMASIDGYHVAGKTGTTRRNNPQGGYYTDQYRAVFVGVAPASNPRFAVAVLLEDPRKNQYAGPATGPLFASVMQEALRLYNVPFDKPLQAVSNSHQKQLSTNNNKTH